MTSHYDDPRFSYEHYWHGRDYEHEGEKMAIQKLLAGKRFAHAADIGAGFGRLIPIVSRFACNITLVEPSKKHRKMAANYTSAASGVTIAAGTSEKTGLPDNSQDLATIVRVLHHLPDCLPTLTELHRILKPGGILILEYANSLNFKSRIRSFFLGHPIPTTPIERRSPLNIRKNTIPFVNHHPKFISSLLRQSGFKITTQLSVSNFRNPTLKKYLPKKLLYALESGCQFQLGRIYFGPSIFVKAVKVDKRSNP